MSSTPFNTNKLINFVKANFKLLKGVFTLKSKLDIIIGIHIASTILSSIFSIVMLILTIKHDKNVTGGSLK